MNIKKSLLVAGVVTSVGVAGLGGNALVSAATDTGAKSDSNSLVTKISEKFNLKTEDVQAVFDEERTAHQAERQAEAEKTLTQAVTDKKITAEQKDKIIAKQKELQTAREADRDAMKDKTDAERKAAMDENRTELEKWASDNGISTEYLRYVMGGGHGGRGGPGGPGGTNKL